MKFAAFLRLKRGKEKLMRNFYFTFIREQQEHLIKEIRKVVIYTLRVRKVARTDSIVCLVSIYNLPSYRSNGAKDAVPHDASHVVHKLEGSGPGIHAGCNDVFHRCVIVGLQLKENCYEFRLH